ncbi:hypothetical protein OZX65_06740 [Leuconostocaceae bacterium ESL0723]|nr:hypothetical protein OZX65_06740 [Leuconostocaceae bacterium ESL0723]
MKKFSVIWPWIQAVTLLVLLVLYFVTNKSLYLGIGMVLGIVFAVFSFFHPALDTKRIKKYYEEHRDEFE